MDLFFWASIPIFLIQILLEIIIKLINKGKLTVFPIKENGFCNQATESNGTFSINVNLTYLRGIEIAKLRDEDMPMVFN